MYPYGYMCKFDRFNDKHLPEKDKFFSILNNEHISDEQCEHAQKVWLTFNIKIKEDYHDLILGFDVLLLANFSENFRSALCSTTSLIHDIN